MLLKLWSVIIPCLIYEAASFELGTVTPNGQYLLQTCGESVTHGVVPWHAGIYIKRYAPYKQICGGSLVSATIVISAAHCFWNEWMQEFYSASLFAVALGKMYRPWDNDHDTDPQKFDVKEITVPPHFYGLETHYQHDIALVKLDHPAVYWNHIRPVCVDFDINFDSRQLKDGNMGKIAGWGFTSGANNSEAKILQILELPTVSIASCMKKASSVLRQVITGDKFCAGYWNGSKVLRNGDSGGGLAFAESEGASVRYYLRGVASSVATDPTAEGNAQTVSTFTQISRHEHFIRQNVVQLEHARCKLSKHRSVEYRCLLTDDNNLRGTRQCEEFEPNGTEVEPKCNPNYYYSGVLSYMKCIDGAWDYIAICQPDCGKLTPVGIPLIINCTNAKRGEVPWHAGVYRKNFHTYEQICGGSLVSTTAVISAAHCFENTEMSSQQNAENYAVALGKLYRRWDHPNDTEAQKFNVSDIRIPPHYSGEVTYFQDDIALVILSTPAVLANHIRPICISLDYLFDKRQLAPGNMGKVAGWGVEAEDGHYSSVLKTTEIPYVDLGKCIVTLPSSFTPFITSDKFCTGTLNGTALCQGDSGGGLAFPENDRYYLRGVVSTAPRNDHGCNAYAYSMFTSIRKHEGFIRSYLKNDT